MAKKPHWTQTPEGRARVSAMSKASWASGNRKPKRRKMSEEGKQNIAKGQRRRYRRLRKQKEQEERWINLGTIPSEQHDEKQKEEVVVAYLTGRVEEFISSYSRGQGLVYGTIAKRVGEVLLQS